MLARAAVMAASTRGRLIVVEGLDRAGKSTQVERLVARLQAASSSSAAQGGPNSAGCSDASSSRPSAVVFKFPDRTTPIGRMIDDYLKSEAELDDRAVHLLFSANRWESMPAIKEHLLRGTTVICDRYAYSGVAYTFSKPALYSPAAGGSASASAHAAARQAHYAWCRAPDAGLLAPDAVLFLAISPAAARTRGDYGAERYEREETQARVRAAFRLLEADVRAAGGHWTTVDAAASVEQVHEKMWAALQQCTAWTPPAPHADGAAASAAAHEQFNMSLFTNEPPDLASVLAEHEK